MSLARNAPRKNKSALLKSKNKYGKEGFDEMKKEFTFGEKIMEIIAYSNNMIRVRYAAAGSESLFDRYNLLAKPEEDCGTDIENGVQSGDLSVTYENGVITFKTYRVERTIDLNNDDIAAVKAYFNETLGGMRPEPKSQMRFAPEFQSCPTRIAAPLVTTTDAVSPCAGSAGIDFSPISRRMLFPVTTSGL
jgi:hypothetical protein